MASPSGDSHQCQQTHDYDHCNNGLGEHFNEDDGEDIMLINDDGVIRVQAEDLQNRFYTDYIDGNNDEDNNADNQRPELVITPLIIRGQGDCD